MQVNSGFDALKMLGKHALRRKALASLFLQLYGTFLLSLLAFGQVENNIRIPFSSGEINHYSKLAINK